MNVYLWEHSLFAIKDENVFKQLLNREHYGIVYIVWRIKDQNGNKLAKPQPYVGQSVVTGKTRFGNEKSKARALRDGKSTIGNNDRYISTMASYDSSICSIEDAFRLQVWDVCYDQLELDLKEAFWTDHFDSDNPEVGLNYFRGPPKWAYSRSGGTYITRGDLRQGILEGLNYKEFLTDHRFMRSVTSIRNYIQKHIRDEDGNVVIGVLNARVALIKPYLKEAISSGLNRIGVLDHLIAHGVTLIDKVYGDKLLGLKYYIKNLTYAFFIF